MSATVLRYIEMLGMIPAHPGGISARQLHDRLLASRHDVNVRTVERDLHKLSRRFPLEAYGTGPVGWRWRKGAKALALPPPSPEGALAYVLLQRFAAPLLPRGMLRCIARDFDQAAAALNRLPDSAYARWKERIAVVPAGFHLLPPDVAKDVVEVAYDAVLRSRRFEVDYRGHGYADWRRFRVNPLGLVQAGAVFYVVATLWDYDEVVHLALHRMRRPMLLDDAAGSPAGFDFQRHVIEERSFEWPHGRSIKLQLDVRGWLAQQLSEQKLAPDQKITPPKDGNIDSWHRVTATVMESEQLFRWLCGLGGMVRVSGPLRMRRRLIAESAAR